MADGNQNADVVLVNNPGQAGEIINNHQNQANRNRTLNSAIFWEDLVQKIGVFIFYLGLDVIIYGLVYPMALCLAYSFLIRILIDFPLTLELLMTSLMTYLLFFAQLELLRHENKFIQQFVIARDSYYSHILVARDHLNIYILSLSLISLADSIQKLILLSDQKNTFFNYLLQLFQSELFEQESELKNFTTAIPYIFWTSIKGLGIPVPNYYLYPTPPLIDIYLAELFFTITVMTICISKLVFFNSVYVLEFSMRQIADPLLEIINDIDQGNRPHEPEQLDANQNVIPQRRHQVTFVLEE